MPVWVIVLTGVYSKAYACIHVLLCIHTWFHVYAHMSSSIVRFAWRLHRAYMYICIPLVYVRVCKRVSNMCFTCIHIHFRICTYVHRCVRVNTWISIKCIYSIYTCTRVHYSHVCIHAHIHTYDLCLYSYTHIQYIFIYAHLLYILYTYTLSIHHTLVHVHISIYTLPSYALHTYPMVLWGGYH